MLDAPQPVQSLRQTKATLLLILGLGLLLLVWQSTHRQKLVVYCAHDAEFAQSILDRFEKETGIPVIVKYDTEATKSLGLVEQIKADGTHPHCDVFWNNELLGTLDLAEGNLLEPYQGPGWQRIPGVHRDEKGRWAGFAARLRMKIQHAELDAAIEPVLRPGEPPAFDNSPHVWLKGVPADYDPAKPYDRFAIAKPLYGTTLTHYAVLWDLWGPEKLKFWHTESRARGLVEVAGNAMVRDAVASGESATTGFTDTDDYFEALDHHDRVTATPVLVDGQHTICIPNTVAIIRGTQHLDDARKLADFLLSAQTELALARSASRQIPIGSLTEQQKNQLPEQVRALLPAAAQAYPLTHLLAARNACLAWLKTQYLK